jgi:hypothetical protein
MDPSDNRLNKVQAMGGFDLKRKADHKMNETGNTKM